MIYKGGPVDSKKLQSLINLVDCIAEYKNRVKILNNFFKDKARLFNEAQFILKWDGHESSSNIAIGVEEFIEIQRVLKSIYKKQIETLNEELNKFKIIEEGPILEILNSTHLKALQDSVIVKKGDETFDLRKTDELYIPENV